MQHHRTINITTLSVIATLLGATSEALYAPLSKIFVSDTGVLMSLAFIFFGAGAGLLLVLLFGRKSKAIFDPARHLQKKDTGKLIGIILLTALANVLLLIGLQQESAASTSMLRNLATVATVVFAATLLHEKISKRLGIGVALIVLGCTALSITNIATFSFSTGALFIIGGCIAFGSLYTVMKLLADRNPVECGIIRGFGVGVLALIAAFCFGEHLPSLPSACSLMAVGFIGCGLSGLLMMYGQRHLGSAKAGAIFGIYPLIGVLLAFPLLGEIPSAAFLAALIMFIPGMYFVITKNSGTAAGAEDPEKSGVEDTRFFASVNETRKTEIRNHVTSFGLLVIAVFFAMMMLGAFDSGTVGGTADVLSFSIYLPGIIFGIFLLLCGVALLILGKRVLSAVTFILMSSQMFATAVLGGVTTLSVLSGIFSFLFACILLTSKDPQKYAYAAVNVFLGAATLSGFFSSVVFGIIMAAATVFLIWLSVACGTEKLRFSISKYLVEDSNITFGKCGAVIGFLLLAKAMAITVIFELTDPSYSTFTDGVFALGMFSAGFVVLVGLLLLFIGKQHVLAIFFIGGGLSLFLDLISTGLFAYLSVILLLVLGIQNVLRKNSPILPSFMLIGCAFSTMLYNQLASLPEVATAMLLIDTALVGIGVYLSFAVFSEKPKLPLF